LEDHPVGQVRRHDHHRLRTHGAVLRPAEAQHVHVRRDIRERAAQPRSRVGKAGTIGEQPQPLGPAELRQFSQFSQ
jgi:hypothetical protein